MELVHELTLSYPGRQQLRTPAPAASVRCETDILDAILRARLARSTVRAVGSRGSKNACYQTEGTALHLDDYNQVLAIDGSRVTVQAGITCGRLNETLWQHGLSLPTQGEWQGATIGGALATGVHGGALGHGILPTSVSSLRLVTGTGTAIDIHRGTEIFNRLAVSLGLFGVTSTVTFDCAPASYLELHSEVVGVGDFLRDLESLTNGNEFFSAVWIPGTRQVITWAANPAAPPPRVMPRRQRYSFGVTMAHLLSQRLGIRELPRGPFTTRAVDASHRILTPIGQGSRVTRIVRSLTRHWREAEFAVPLKRAGEAVTRLEKLVSQYPDTLTVPVGLRPTAADGFSLSPCRGRESFWIAVFYRDRNGFGDELSGLFEDLDGRNHWGKYPNLPSDHLKRQYPEWDELGAMRRQHDPSGVFANAFSERFTP